MKEEDLSLIKRYPIVEYLERKGIKPIRLTPSYALYRSPLRAEIHPAVLSTFICGWRAAHY